MAFHQDYQRKYRPTWQNFKGTVWSYFLSASGFLITLPSVVYLVSTTAECMPLIIEQGTTALIGASSHFIFSGFSAILGTTFLYKGAKLRARMRRFKRYRLLLDDQSQYAISDIAQIVDRSPNFVAKDLQKMIGDDLFTDVYLDKSSGTIFIGKQNYLPIIHKTAEEITVNAQTETEQIIDEGRKQVAQIRTLSVKCTDPIVKNHMARLEEICDKIFVYTAQNPKKLPEIRRFLNFYLPTTVKLLTAYEKFQWQNVQGDNLSSAINSIENVLQTIVIAFEKLLDDLFSDEVLDISTDIAVLENMLEQEGLTDGDFKV